MKPIFKTALLLTLVAGLVACGDDTDNGPNDAGTGEAFPDGAQYLWDCDNPGGSCNAHDTCVLAAVCGEDRKCHPKQLQNCDDGLDCTQDLCKGKGVCLNQAKPGLCALPVKTEKDGKTVTVMQCFKKGDRNPEDSCLVCNPDGDAGSSADWGLANGGACDDKNTCTKNDYCQSGVCKGEDYSKECADKYTCTDDVCDGKGGCGTEHKLRSDYCIINDQCYKDQQQDQSGCNMCDVKISQSKWTPLSVHCLIDKACYKPGANDSTGCSTCDPTKNPTGWTPIPGLCKISSVCYKAGALHPQGCAECDPNTSATAWTVKSTTDCLINNTCYKSGASDSTGCAKCDPAQSKTAWTTVTNMCKIDSKCYAANAQHPQGCAICEPATSSSTWTVKTNNCLIGSTCYQPGAKDSTACSSCDPTKSKTDWSPLPGLCKIGGKCYQTGAKDPTGCAECDPATSPTSWTVKGANCLIGTTCYQPAQASPNGCGTCDPTKSKTAWSPVANKCLIGDSCFANQTKDSTGCLICDVAKNPSGWTPVAGVTTTVYNFDDGKNPPAGWTIKSSDAKVGWVVSNLRAVGGSYSLYYGDPATKTYDSPGDANNGTADMPAITLPAGKKAGLSFWLYMDTETSPSYDTIEVFVNGKSVWAKSSTTKQTTWQEITVDLSSYAGQSIVIQFSFDTSDSVSNDSEGTYVDSVTVYSNC